MPPSSRAGSIARPSRSKVERAADLYERFTGHDADEAITINHDPIDIGVPIGTLDGVLYTTVRDGNTEKYIHRFRKKSRPLLFASHDGKRLGIVGGQFLFDERGIEDK